MTRKSIALSALCALILVLGAWLPVAWRHTSSASSAAVSAKRCKTVIKKVHGQKKKVHVCRKAPPTPTPVPPLFNGPSELVIDSHGNILVADQKNQRIVTLSPSGAILSTWTKAGSNPAGFQQLYGIALDKAENIYVTDAANHVVDKLAPTGQPLAQWSTKFGGLDSFPTLLTVASTGDVYVSDDKAGGVLHLSATGALLGEIGKGDFTDPYGIATGPKGNLYTTDFTAGRVHEYTPDGKLMATWGDGANGTVALQKLEAIAVDPQGNIYVTEQINHVIKFDATGHMLADWGGTSALTLSDPSGLALDPQGNIYIAEFFGNRVDKLSPTGQVLAIWK